jgi:hypothetical protein
MVAAVPAGLGGGMEIVIETATATGPWLHRWWSWVLVGAIAADIVLFAGWTVLLLVRRLFGRHKVQALDATI